MAKSVRNGNLHSDSSEGLAVGIYQSSDESSTMQEEQSDTHKPSDDTEAEDMEISSDHAKNDQLSHKVTDSKKSSPEATTPCSMEITEDISASVSDAKKDDQTGAEQAIDRPNAAIASYLSDNNFADNEDNEDSCSTYTQVQDRWEHLREIRTPKEVNIGKVINRRRKRKRSLAAYMGGKNSPLYGLRQSRRQRDASGCEKHLRAVITSSDSSQDVKVSEKVIGPTTFSSDLFSQSTSSSLAAGVGPSSASLVPLEGPSSDNMSIGEGPSSESLTTGEGPSSESLTTGEGPSSESLTTGEGPSSESLTTGEGPSSESLTTGEGPSSESLKTGEGPSSATVIHSSDSSNKTFDDPRNQKPNVPGDSGHTEASKSVRRKTPDSLPSTSKTSSLPISPLPSTPEDEAPSQYLSSLFLAENLQGNPHASRVNTLTSLLDRVVSFSDHLESLSLFSDPDPSPHAASGEDVRNLRELQEDFRHCCNVLSSSEVKDEDEASENLVEFVEQIRQRSRQLNDRLCYSQDERRVPQSNEPLSIEELHYYLPNLWDAIMSNNMVLNQWTCTLLDWCLKTEPELHPQQFYDTEAGTRRLFSDISEVHRSINSLLARWTSQSMHEDELADLVYLHFLSSTATILYSLLESEVVNIRYNLGTRPQASEGSAEEKKQFQSKKSKKE